MRKPTACSGCRASRKKCFRRRPIESCDACIRRGVPCSFSRTASTSTASSVEIRPPSSTGTDDLMPAVDLPIHIIHELVEHYIHFVLDRPHTLFHLPTLRAEVRQNSLKPGLLLAILAFGCRFHKDEEVCTLGPSFFEASKRSLHSELGDICLDNIQTCVLLANLSSSIMDSKSEALYIGIGIRMGEIMGIDTPDPEDSTVLGEIKRRVWWTLYLADRWCSTGRNLRRTMGDFCDTTLGLPMDEYVFHRLSSDYGEPEDGCLSTTQGLRAYNVLLAEQFGMINDLNKDLVREHLGEEYIDHRVGVLAGNLRRWRDELPVDKTMSDSNIDAHVSQGLGGVFMALHAGFHHYSSLLFFQFLDTSRPRTPKSEEYAQLCRQHAIDQSRLIERSRNTPGCEIIFGGVGHNAVVSSAVLLHMLMFSTEPDPAEIRARLEANFAAITELEKYWPSLSHSKRRLQVFQQTCINPCEPQTYKIDQWMVRFLLEHHLPLSYAEGGSPSIEMS